MKKIPLGFFLFPRLASILLAVVGFFMIEGTASAQIPVTDGVSIGNDLQEYLTQAQNWIEEKAQYVTDNAMQANQFQQQIKEYQSSLSKLQSIATGTNFSSILGASASMQRVDADYMVEDVCPTPSGVAAVVQGAIGMLPSLNLGDGSAIDIRKRQQENCIKIQMTKNAKYNRRIDFLNEVMPSVDKLHDEMQARRNNTTETGPALANITDNTSYQTAVDSAINKYRLEDVGFDNYLSFLQNDQVTLARLALKGQRATALKSMVNTTALMEGLDVSASDLDL